MKTTAALLAMFMLAGAANTHAAARPVCAVTRAAYDAHMLEAKHPRVADIEHKLVLPLVEAINEIPPASHFRADAITTYESYNPDLVRLAFFWRGCLIDDITSARAALVYILATIAAKRNDL